MDNVFQTFSSHFNLKIDQIRYVALFFLSFPLAFVLRQVFHYKHTSNVIRHSYCMILGILFFWLCFKWQTLYLVIFVSVGYLLLLILPPSTVHIYSMIYAILGVSTGHIYRMITDYGGYTLDFTGPLMMMVQRVSYVAFAYHDGLTNCELNEDQKKQKINTLPSLLEYLSYNFCFLTILVGPTATYKEYDEFITGKNMNNKVTTEPNPLIPMFKKLIGSVTFMLILVLNYDKLPRNLILDPNLSYPRWYANVVVHSFLFRCRYYFSFLIAESICNAGGLGFNGYDDKGNEKWDLVKCVDVLKLEFSVNLREFISAWNITTAAWIRRVVYERITWHPVLLSHMLSAVWHGFYPGYYVTFVCLSLGTMAARKWRRLLWHQFQHPPVVKILYDAFSITVCCVCREVQLLTFSLLLLNDVFTIWKYHLFLPFIVAVVVIVTFPNKTSKIKEQ